MNEEISLSLYDESKIDSQPVLAKKQIAERHLSDAIHTVLKIMHNSKSEKRRMDAAIWIAEMVLGKPKDAAVEEHEKKGQEIALLMAQTLREIASKGNDELDQSS